MIIKKKLSQSPLTTPRPPHLASIRLFARARLVIMHKSRVHTTRVSICIRLLLSLWANVSRALCHSTQYDTRHPPPHTFNGFSCTDRSHNSRLLSVVYHIMRERKPNYISKFARLQWTNYIPPGSRARAVMNMYLNNIATHAGDDHKFHKPIRRADTI